ncbi:hypothetical protein KY285_008316 [Solanum tuberosum]|nr:hypothetical protein KY285_008316 [Solanum tuberosum]
MERGHGDELLSEKRKACFQELAPGGWQAEWCRMLELTSNVTLFYNKLEKLSTVDLKLSGGIKIAAEDQFAKPTSILETCLHYPLGVHMVNHPPPPPAPMQ